MAPDLHDFIVDYIKILFDLVIDMFPSQHK